MIDIHCHHDHRHFPLRPTAEAIFVLLYGTKPLLPMSACIGGNLLPAAKCLGVLVDQRAFDLLTLAMGIIAADTFASRNSSADGWVRELRLTISLAEPEPWQQVKHLLEDTLRFLSGDIWTLNIQHGGPKRPAPKSRGPRTNLAGHDSVCLFSGGLDSLVGVLDLLAEEKRPVLVSHSYRGDAARQALIYSKLPISVSRFSAAANPLSNRKELNDIQMRTRSFGFLAYGALVAATMRAHQVIAEPVTLYVPENGLISLNPPLTLRRIGALSTRTTHPHFLALMERIFNALDIPVRIVNRYADRTKGQMLSECKDPLTLRHVSHHTISCGKWKRSRLQCGKCVPCIIRRASFHAAGIVDNTGYDPDGQELRRVLKNEKARDDLLATMTAVTCYSEANIKEWVALSGPLPRDRFERSRLFDVASNGLKEIGDFLSHNGVLI